MLLNFSLKQIYLSKSYTYRLAGPGSSIIICRHAMVIKTWVGGVISGMIYTYTILYFINNMTNNGIVKTVPNITRLLPKY